MKALFRFMVSTPGRGTRAIAGAVLVAGGLLLVGGPLGVVIALIGLVPLIAGPVDVCVFAPIFGYPFNGDRARSAI